MLKRNSCGKALDIARQVRLSVIAVIASDAVALSPYKIYRDAEDEMPAGDEILVDDAMWPLHVSRGGG
jgi:hypothetical protein